MTYKRQLESFFIKLIPEISKRLKEKNKEFGIITDNKDFDFNYSGQKDNENIRFINVSNKDTKKIVNKILFEIAKNINKVSDLKYKWEFNNKVIANLPHFSTYIPQEYKRDYLLTKNELNKEVFEYADLYTDELFENLYKYSGGVKNKFSRLFMDPERFFNDELESMSKKGLGWYYTNAITEKKELRNIDSKNDVKKYYLHYHQKLNNITKQKLNQFGECIIIDCHSFSNNRYWFHYNIEDIPDICIGFEDFHKDNRIIEIFKAEFKELKIGINYPYEGSIVPNDYYKKNPNVKSIMIEINKKLYLEKDNKTKSKNFEILKSRLNKCFYKIFYKLK